MQATLSEKVLGVLTSSASLALELGRMTIPPSSPSGASSFVMASLWSRPISDSGGWLSAVRANPSAMSASISEIVGAVSVHDREIDCGGALHPIGRSCECDVIEDDPGDDGRAGACDVEEGAGGGGANDDDTGESAGTESNRSVM